MSLPRVDVVLASNRGGPFLDEAIDTALDQAGVSVRVILVDDGSPDPASLDRAAARREGVDLVRQPPRGVSAARNTGLERVDADLVAFLDDDDVWEPTLLHTLLGALSDDPAAVGAYCGGFYLDAAGHRFGVGARPTSQPGGSAPWRHPDPDHHHAAPSCRRLRSGGRVRFGLRVGRGQRLRPVACSSAGR